MSNKGLAIFILIWAFIAIGTIAFTLTKCGAKSFLYGNGAFAVAASGMCDK